MSQASSTTITNKTATTTATAPASAPVTATASYPKPKTLASLRQCDDKFCEVLTRSIFSASTPSSSQPQPRSVLAWATCS